MKKTPLLNVALSRLIASLGHGDIVVIGDAGLPVPPGVELIDLALTQGIPDFLSTLQVVLCEMQVEGHVLAQEILDRQSPVLQALEALSTEGRWARASCWATMSSRCSAARRGPSSGRASVSLIATLL